MSIDSDSQGTSTRPYLVRALHDWCTDNGFTPLLAVHVDESVRVPMEFVKNNEIVLNVSFDATSGLRLGNEFIDFKARFGGIPRDIAVPIDHVIAIYARENGQGMAFPVPTEPSTLSNSADVAASAPPAPAATGLRLASEPTVARPDGDEQPPPPSAPPAGGRPSLKRIK
ncbi:ClpXP protease specificity-enhancing factor [Sphaerotilus montanus]|jgi:stringent starvation protein B|uniref:Stringent starvation protein B n=1 Tax=Sphaerotilus montanus TaxID=522889 RepID=A0A7Y9QYA3_9BURK|nr:ClpXP protease specificity-enhancing factor [Sphaerotilus montanus]NYG33633.1 stringent starvation protein B [Sphaerotilus montanus]NZD58501.1 ClpXP protease specificity-enhancing factor [Sphaerotilus montanus]